MSDVIDGTAKLPEETPPQTSSATSPIPVQLVLIPGPKGETGDIGPQGAGGPAGPPGLDGFTTTTANFTQPAVSGTVVVSVAHGLWGAVGQAVYVPGAGYMAITATASLSITLQNIGISGNSSPGTIISSGTTVAPAGTPGATGATGATGQSAFTTTTASFSQPAIGSTVNVAVVSSVWVVAGQGVFIAGGGYYVVTAVPDSNHVTVLNLDVVGNAVPTSSVGSGAAINGTGAPGINAFTLTTSSFTQPPIGNTVIVPIANTASFVVNQQVFVAGGGYYSVFAIPDQLHITLQNLDVIGNTASGATISTSAAVVPAGAPGTNAYTTVTSQFTVPAISSTVNIAIGNSSWIVVGQTLFVFGAGYLLVTATPDLFHVTLQNTGQATAGAIVSIASGVTPAGAQGVSSFTRLTANFTQPAANATVSVQVATTAWMAVGQALYIAGGGYYLISNVTDITDLVLTNLGYLGNAAPAATVTNGSGVTAAGIHGIDAYTTTTANFTQPAVGSTVVVTVDNSAWASVGQTVYVVGGGTYSITALTDVTHMTLLNTGALGNASPTSVISSTASVSPSGPIGQPFPADLVLVSSVENTSLAQNTAVGGRFLDLTVFPLKIGALTRTATFFADIQSSNGGATASVQLRNVTDNEVVTGTSLSTQQTSPTELSGAVTVGAVSGNLKTGKFYMVMISILNGLASDRVTITNARIVVTYQ